MYSWEKFLLSEDLQLTNTTLGEEEHKSQGNSEPPTPPSTMTTVSRILSILTWTLSRNSQGHVTIVPALGEELR